MVAHPHKTAPGPRGLELLDIIFGYYRDPLGTLGGVARKYGDITRFQLGSLTFFQITHPGHIQHIFQDNNRNYRIGDNYGEVEPVSGRGLATNHGEAWLWARRLMQPLFARGQVGVFVPLMAEKMGQLLDRWQAAAREGRVVRLYPDLLAANHHILGRMLFGVDFVGEHESILRALRVTREYTSRRINAVVKVPTHIPTPRNRAFWSSVELLNRFTYSRIGAARAADKPGDDLLSILMSVRDEKTGVGMTDEQLHDELMTLFFVAYEDAANALAWALSFLMMSPAVMERTRTEIESVLGGRVPTYADLNEMVYTNAVVQEGLRLYPPTWAILRDVIEDDVVDGYRLPKGSTALINVYLAHRLPEFWPQPDVFDPDRFLPERSAGRPRYAYLPFGGGPRQCIAAALAMMQIKLMLVMILQRYQVESVARDMPKPAASHSLRPTGDLMVRLRPV